MKNIIDQLLEQGERLAENMRTAAYGPGGGISGFSKERTLEYKAAKELALLRDFKTEAELTLRFTTMILQEETESQKRAIVAMTNSLLEDERYKL